MPSISQVGTYNINALTVADVYVQIVPPQFRLNGVPSSIFGVVGTASWGPVNQPQIVGSYAEFVQIFGPMLPRTYDMGTAAWIAFMQGPAGMGRFVRVTDGSDLAATITAQTNCITFTSKYTGSYGNSTVVYVDTGSALNSYRARVVMPGMVPEMFDNIFKGVSSVAVDTAGTGYTSVPAVTFSAPQIAGGRRARGHVTLSTTTVGAVVIDDPGTGYTSAPTITFSGGGGSGAAATATIAVWPAMVDAINNGQSGMRGPSDYVVASAGGGTTAPSTASYTLVGGSDGAAAITGTILLGTDSVPRTGMYALRGQGCSVAMLTDCTDTSTWATQVSFGTDEGCMMALCGPASQSISSAISAKSGASIDTFVAKILLGDWLYMNDTVNNLPNRLVSPQAFFVGRRANLSPENSSLNKPVQGVVASQKTTTGMPYTQADLSALAVAGIDVLTSPSPGGGYFAFRNGRNASSDPSRHGENYTTMTFYIAKTLAAGMGIYIGELQSRRKDDRTRARAKATIDSFMAVMANQQPTPMIDQFQTILDKSNNADDTIGLGYMFAYVRVVYMAVVEFFVVNLEGGQTVQITTQSQAPFA